MHDHEREKERSGQSDKSGEKALDNIQAKVRQTSKKPSNKW